MRIHPRPLLHISDHLTRTKCQLEFENRDPESLFICGLLFGLADSGAESAGSAVECTFATELLPLTEPRSDAGLAESIASLLTAEMIKDRVEMIKTVLSPAEEVQGVYLYSRSNHGDDIMSVVKQLVENLQQALETASIDLVLFITNEDMDMTAIAVSTGKSVPVDLQSSSTQHETITCQSLLLSTSSSSAENSASKQLLQDYIGAIDVLSSKVSRIIDYLKSVSQKSRPLNEQDYLLLQQINALTGRLNKRTVLNVSNDDDSLLLTTSQLAETVRIMTTVSAYNQSQREPEPPKRMFGSRSGGSKENPYSITSRFDAAFDDDQQPFGGRGVAKTMNDIIGMQTNSSPFRAFGRDRAELRDAVEAVCEYYSNGDDDNLSNGGSEGDIIVE